MRTKSWILLAMALGCGLVASVAISQVVLEQRKGAPEIQMVEILVASKDINAAHKLSADNIKAERWPKDRVPVGAMTEFRDVDGKYANQSLFQGEPVVKKKLINSAESLADTIPKGFKLFDLPVKDNSSEINYIKPGDRVDIFGFFEKGGRVPETKTLLIVENVTVKAVDGNAVRDNGEQGGKAIKNIQLLIRDSQYEAVNTATNLGKLRVALRPLSEDSQSEETANGTTFLSWIRTADKVADPTAGSSPKPKIDFSAMMAPPPAQPKNEDAGEMIIISPSGASKYKWDDKDDVPTLVVAEQKQTAAIPTQMISGTPSGNMTWNPSAGSWSTSGFSPSYPGADGAVVPKKGEAKDAKEGKPEKSE